MTGKILAEQEEQWVSLAIFGDDVTRGYFAPDEAYAVARCLEWVGEPGEPLGPNNIMPPTVGVLFAEEDDGTGRVAYIVLSDEDGERAGAIELDASRSAQLADQLYTCAVEAAFYWEEEEDE